MNREESIKKLSEMIEGIQFAMLTTYELDGTLRSRPMATQNKDFDGNLWFFSGRTSHKIEDLHHNPHVNLAYADSTKNRYVSVSGLASVVEDRKKIEELWSPELKAWFPKGLEDPELCLLQVRIDHAEFWDSPSSKMVQLFGFAKSLVTGEPYKPSEEENKKINLAG